MFADLIIENHDCLPVVFVEVKARTIGSEGLRSFMANLENAPDSLRFGILVDPRTIRIYRRDSKDSHPIVAELDAGDVLHHYSSDFAGEKTSYGTARVFHIYLTGLVDAWLSDLAFSWKGGDVPRKDVIRSIGLLPHLEGRSIINQDAIRGYPVR